MMARRDDTVKSSNKEQHMPRFLSEERNQFDAVITECFELADTQTEELFGDRQRSPKDEFAIVFDWSLTHEAKVQKLKAIRAGKRSRTAACPVEAKQGR
jgi:hypothetical protein